MVLEGCGQTWSKQKYTHAWMGAARRAASANQTPIRTEGDAEVFRGELAFSFSGAISEHVCEEAAWVMSHDFRGEERVCEQQSLWSRAVPAAA
jgi:hypothetical protein